MLNLITLMMMMMCLCLLPGSLHFVNVVPEDAKGGATYACVAKNRVMRGIQRGEFNTIAPFGGGKHH